MSDDRLAILCLLTVVTPEIHFDPNQEIDPDAEQCLRVNIEAQKDRLPKFVAHLMLSCYRLGKKART